MNKMFSERNSILPIYILPNVVRCYVSMKRGKLIFVRYVGFIVIYFFSE